MQLLFVLMCSSKTYLNSVSFESEDIAVNHPSVASKVRDVYVLTSALYPQHNSTVEGKNTYVVPKAVLNGMLLCIILLYTCM